MGVMSDNNRTFAVVVFYFLANHPEQFVKDFIFSANAMSQKPFSSMEFIGEASYQLIVAFAMVKHTFAGCLSIADADSTRERLNTYHFSFIQRFDAATSNCFFG